MLFQTKSVTKIAIEISNIVMIQTKEWANQKPTLEIKYNINNESIGILYDYIELANSDKEKIIKLHNNHCK